MQGISMTRPTYRSPCKHKDILPNWLNNERYLLAKWIWNLHLDHFDDGWIGCIRAPSLMFFFQMKMSFFNIESCSFWWEWFVASLDELLQGQGEDLCLHYDLENDENVFSPSIYFDFFCIVDHKYF